MSKLWDFLASFPSLSPAQLDALVVLAGFGLAAFSIYAVLEIAKGPRK